MKTLFAAAIVTAALSAGAVSAQAQNETDRAMGAGSYIHPNGPAGGSWSTPATNRSSGLGVTTKKYKAR